MTHPGSKHIDNIDFNSLVYLTDINTVSSTITSSDFNMTTGKPLKNLTTNSQVDAFFLSMVENSLKENQNVNNQLIYDYPQMCEIDVYRDLEITSETVIDLTFIMEGASMQNMFGYYMYEIVNGEPKLLDNDGEIGDNYYKPTVVFPYIFSEDNNSNTLERGNTRRLRGNNANGNFENIHVGFFLIPHGWFAFDNGSGIGNDSILYSTVSFNIQYEPVEYQMVNDKIYSIFAKSESEGGDKMLFVGFEDVFYHGIYNLDYNDCTVGIYASNVLNIVDYDSYAELVIEEETVNNNIVFIDDEGEYVEFDDNIYNIDTNFSHIFERHLKFDTENKRDTYYDIYSNMLTHYFVSIEKIDDIQNNIYKIVSKYRFRHNDLNNAKKNGKKKLYLIEVKFSNGPKSYLVRDYQNFMQKMLQDENYDEDYKLYQEIDTSVEIIHLTDAIDLPKKSSNLGFRIIGNGVMDCEKGKAHLPLKTSTIYQVYKNISSDLSNGLVINVKMDDHPEGYQLGKKTFVRYISFIVNNNSNSEHIVLDLGNLDLYQEQEQEGNYVLNLNNDYEGLNVSLSSIHISEIKASDSTIKGLVRVFRNNSGATFRTVTVNNSLIFYCIRFSNIKNNPTMVFLDGDYLLHWNNKINVTGGTYYTKQKTYPVSHFTEIL